MKVIQNMLPSSKYDIKSPRTMVAQFYVVHNTANDASARNEISYMIGNNNKVSYHYAIDDKEVVQAIPENRNAYHAGNSLGNNNGIGVEICYSKSGGSKFVEAEKNTAKFLANGLYEKGWNVKDNIKKHQDFSGKYCPHKTLDLGWKRFLNMIQGELNLLNNQKMDKSKEVSKWAEDGYKFVTKHDISDGTRPKDNITREEIWVMFERYNKKFK